jgi:hypothetical protein
MGNSTCCNIKDFALFGSKEKKVTDDINYRALLKLIKIQTIWKSIVWRKKFVRKHRKKNLRALTKYFITPDGFNEAELPGKTININNIQVHENVFNTEKKLGDFVIDEKELIKYIEENKNKLKNYSIQYEDGSIYYGYYNKSWEREGYGVLIQADGSKFQGFFKNNKMNGRGRIVGIEGDYYEGEFVDDKANVYGKYVNKEGGIYIGQWKDEKQHGTGEENFPDGSRYEGQYYEGSKHGKGKISWTDGSSYEGDFLNNEFEGNGLYKWRDGRVFQGSWKGNKMDGLGVFIWPDRKKYIGQYKNDKKCGVGVFIWPDNKKYEGNWKNGKQNGFGIYTSKGLRRFGEWVNGKKEKWLSEDTEDYKKLLKELEKNVICHFNDPGIFSSVKNDDSNY